MMRKTTEFSLEDVLEAKKREVMLQMNCHHLAKVTAFNSQAMTVSAQIMYSRTFYFENDDGTTTTRIEPYPLLTDVPVIVLGGGKAAITFPIQAGDECVVMFNDRDIDNWFSGAKSGSLNSGRLHSLADGIALIGLIRPQGFDPARAGITNGSSKVMVGQKVLVSNGTDTLGALIQQLTSQLNTLTTTLSTLTVTGVTGGTGTSGPPSQATQITQVGTQISQIATKLGGLLE